MLKLIWEIFLFYMLYKFIFGLVIPVYRTTRQVKKQMNQFHQHVQNQQGEGGDYRQSSRQTTPKTTSVDYDHEYVEFEEVKK